MKKNVTNFIAEQIFFWNFLESFLNLFYFDFKFEIKAKQLWKWKFFVKFLEVA